MNTDNINIKYQSKNSLIRLTSFFQLTPDSFPFGMLMPNRHENSGQYRFGYQGSEKDDDIKGQGNSYTTHFRLLDPRIGRWLSVDPKASSISWQSPYSSMDNNPILLNDQNGDCSICDHLYEMGIILDRGMLSSDRFIETGNLSVSSTEYSTKPTKFERNLFEVGTQGWQRDIKEITQTITTSTIQWNEKKNEVTITKITTSTTVLLYGNKKTQVTQNVKEQQLKLGVEKGDLPYNKSTYYLDFEFPIIDELKETTTEAIISLDEVNADLLNEVSKVVNDNYNAIKNNIEVISNEQVDKNIEDQYSLPEPASGDVPSKRKRK